MPSLDIVTPKSAFHNCLGACTAQLLSHGRIPDRLAFGSRNRFGFSWKDQFQPLNLKDAGVWTVQKSSVPLIKSVATVEPVPLVRNEDVNRISKFQFDQKSQVSLSSNEDTAELEERERLRRLRISKANKGNVPWNKGRKHSPETLQRIRERTRIAMQDPKVKMKLVNIGHAQSEETRLKIGLGVREGWLRRREKLIVQETCCLEWQNVIAEASRKGFNDQEELQWDSYKILDKQLKKEWLESIEKRKTTPRAKGSKRAPKSLEQRRKISEAISAKWADPVYRERVCSALSKYHGVTVGAERKPRRKPSSDGSPTGQKVLVKKKPSEAEDTLFEEKLMKKPTPKKKKNSGPLYKDPLASSKLEMIKNIRAQRAEMEQRKRETTERAKLLIAEAEKAANALEVAALKSPLARASLLETRKLIAEATRSIESIERREMALQDSGNDVSFNTSAILRPLDEPEDSFIVVPEVRHVNGTHSLSLTGINETGQDFGESPLQNVVNGQYSPTVERKGELNQVLAAHLSPSLLMNGIGSKLNETTATIHASLADDDDKLRVEVAKDEKVKEQAKEAERSTASIPKMKKKWICGRLVEVHED